MDIDEVMRLVAEAVRPFPKAAMFQLAEEGHNTPFEQLIGCILSIRTRDEVMLPTARALFAHANTPAAIAALSIDQLDTLIQRVGLHQNKARQIHAIATTLATQHNNQLPCDRDLILSFHGVGPKCANLALGIGCGQPDGISVDVHVHRITNRWGYVQTHSPEKTMAALEKKLPRQYWLDINRLLVAFGKHICTARPRCTQCPLQQLCPKIGAAED
ncbi:MAG: endonuclease III [Candidatus Promineifilaceae bacterium]